MKNIILLLILGASIATLLGQPSPQSPSYVTQSSDEDRAEQQRILTQAYVSQKTQQKGIINNRQNEALEILSKDPWRKINSSTNYVADEGWLQFQGKIQSIEAVGILLKGKFGSVLTIKTSSGGAFETTTTAEVTDVVDASPVRASTKRKSTAERTQITGTKYEKLYGADFFLVANYPYPTEVGEGVEGMMAFDSGYLTYTNTTHHVLTVRKLDYGTPCIKIWSSKEIAAAKRRAEEERERLQEERARISAAQHRAQEQATEDEKRAREEKVAAQRRAEEERLLQINEAIRREVKKDQEQADEGDSIALRRMGNRYRDGNGVERDSAKAAEYYKKADESIEAKVKKLAEEQRQKELEEQQQRIATYETLSNKGSVTAMIALGKCYRDGNGAEKNLQKAKEIFQKAANTYTAGFERAREDAAKLALTCE